MTEEKRGRRRTQKVLWLALAAVLVLLAAVILPPLISVSRYKAQITQLISTSLGRPVRLSSVEVRLLPRPGFVLTDLTVDEDPEYGAEPVLHANTVTASIRLLTLWRGRLEIGRISVDEASLNLVRSAQGHWNVEPLFRTAAGRGTAQGQSLRLPYLEATDSRINLKNGAEKLPFSLINTDLSFWQERPGDWRLRLRGQPARTDLSLDLADTGIVRLEGSVRRASELRQMPLHIDLEWREAQLGQLTRLIVGSDPGWRGNLTGELHLDGTAESAQIKTRLRAEGVHRAEFAPATPMDFDANCRLNYHFMTRALDNLVCDSPLGNGRIRIAGDRHDADAPPHLSVEMDRVPVQAGLDALRTVRSGFGAGLDAGGDVSGKITYSPVALTNMPAPPTPAKPHSRTKAPPAPPAPLAGSFTVEGFQLRGEGLSTPIQAPKLVLAPVAVLPGQPQALAATVAVPAGGATPLGITVRLASSGYQVTVHGQAGIARARELAHVAGLANAEVLQNMSGDPLSVDLSAEGPWLASPSTYSNLAVAGVTAPSENSSTDRLSGTILLRKVNWKPEFLANPVLISDATLHLGQTESRWDPVDFSYGPVKGTASLTLPAACTSPLPCLAPALPTVNVQFGELNAAALQSAFLGARQPGTLISTLIARIRPASAPAWPEFQSTVKAGSLVLGPVTLQNATVALRTHSDGADISSLDAALFGGNLHASGTLQFSGNGPAKPVYSLNGHFDKLNPAAVGELLGVRWSGGAFSGDGKIDLAGFTDRDLTASAKGSLHFDWQHGAVSSPALPSLARFDHWTATAEIANGAITLKENQVQQGIHNRTLEGAVIMAEPPKVTLAAPKETRAKR